MGRWVPSGWAGATRWGKMPEHSTKLREGAMQRIVKSVQVDIDNEALVGSEAMEKVVSQATDVGIAQLVRALLAEKVDVAALRKGRLGRLTFELSCVASSEG
jgi:hypothetical protein